LFGDGAEVVEEIGASGESGEEGGEEESESEGGPDAEDAGAEIGIGGGAGEPAGGDEEAADDEEGIDRVTCGGAEVWGERGKAAEGPGVDEEDGEGEEEAEEIEGVGFGAIEPSGGRKMEGDIFGDWGSHEASREAKRDSCWARESARLKREEARVRAARPMAEASWGFSRRSRIFFPNSAGSPGVKSRPVESWTTCSGMPPTREATTGVEQAMASRMV